MLRFLFRRVLPWILLAIAVPLVRTFGRHLARAIIRHAVVKPATRALHEADSTVTDVTQRTSRKARQLTPVKR